MTYPLVFTSPELEAGVPPQGDNGCTPASPDGRSSGDFVFGCGVSFESTKGTPPSPAEEETGELVSEDRAHCFDRYSIKARAEPLFGNPSFSHRQTVDMLTPTNAANSAWVNLSVRRKAIKFTVLGIMHSFMRYA